LENETTTTTTEPATTETTTTEPIEPTTTNDAIDYSDALADIHDEIVILNDSIHYQNEFLTGANEIYTILFGVLIGGLIAFAILKGLMKNA
jgi:hypothetical protein